MTIETAKQIKKAEKETSNYLSWLDYKKKNHIVRYYPTFRMYESYVYFSKALGLHCFGEQTPLQEGHKLLQDYLKTRLYLNNSLDDVFNF